MPCIGRVTDIDGLTDVTITTVADDEVLTYDAATGQWINQALPPGATKEKWFSTTIGLANAAQSKRGDHGGYLVDADNEEAITEFHVPHDFTAIDEAVLVILALATETPMTFAIYTDIAANGEKYDTHSGGGAPAMNTTADRILEIDISTYLALISAGDYVGVRFLRDLGANANAIVLGVRFKYT